VNRERFLAKSRGDDRNGTIAGLRKAVELLANHEEVVIVVPQLKNVTDSLLTDVLSEEYAQQLVKARELTFSDGKKIRLCSEATLKNHRHATAYLALWGSKYMIEEVEKLPQCQAVVLVTWLEDDSAEWESSNTVELIYASPQVGSA
jgi:hypothetical protein